MRSPLLTALLASELETASLLTPSDTPAFFAVDPATWVQLELYAADLAASTPPTEN